MKQEDLSKANSIVDFLTSKEIRKGIMNDIQYGAKNLSIKKSGKDIKAKFATLKEDLEKRCMEKKAKQAIILSQLKAAGVAEAPSEEPSSYVFEGMRKSAFGDYPKMFSYETREKYRAKRNSNVAMGGSYGIDSDITKVSEVVSSNPNHVIDLMYNYNDCARSSIRCIGAKLFLDAMIENIDDKQSIEISGSLLKLLV